MGTVTYPPLSTHKEREEGRQRERENNDDDGEDDNNMRINELK